MPKSAAKESTRKRILDAARQEIVLGKGDVEVANVAKRAGVSDGLTYYHFGNKSGLINAIVNDFYGHFDDKVAGVPFEGKTWAEREQARVNAMVTLFYEDPVAMIAVNRLRTDPTFADEEAKRNNRLEQLGASNIASAQKAGGVRSYTKPIDDGFDVIGRCYDRRESGADLITAVNSRPSASTGISSPSKSDSKFSTYTINPDSSSITLSFRE